MSYCHSFSFMGIGYMVGYPCLACSVAAFFFSEILIVRQKLNAHARTVPNTNLESLQKIQRLVRDFLLLLTSSHSVNTLASQEFWLGQSAVWNVVNALYLCIYSSVLLTSTSPTAIGYFFAVSFSVTCRILVCFTQVRSLFLLFTDRVLTTGVSR